MQQTKDSIKLHNEELQNMQSSSRIVRDETKEDEASDVYIMNGQIICAFKNCYWKYVLCDIKMGV